MKRLIPNFGGALILALLVSSAPAQTNFQTLIVGVDHRTVTSLDGDWHYLRVARSIRPQVRSTTAATRRILIPQL
jgi:hypothetical protein